MTNPIRDLLRSGMDTMEIANALNRTEAEVYNALWSGPPRLPPAEFAAEAHRNLIRKSSDLNEQRRGKRAPVSQVQNSQAGRWRRPVSLPKISILED